MPKPLFDTKTLNLSEILGNAKIYKVPRFQRSYSWTEENWEDLWQDIIALKNNEESLHYLGTIVLQTEDNKTFTIIDGQQRLVTLSIVILGCIKLLKELEEKGLEPEKNKDRREIFINSYIGFKDPKALTNQSKLTLNETDKELYNSYLVQLEKPVNLSNLPDSNKLLIKTFDYFLDKLKEQNFKTGDEIVDFIETIIVSKLFFIEIIVDDTISAYTVFETLNARGIELTTTDLLKNYLFSLLDNDIDINNIQPRWDRIVKTVSYRQFPTFLRYYLNSQQKLVRSERLFKEVKQKISKKEDVFKLLENLEKYSEVYVAFDDYENELWQKDKDIKRLIAEINLFGVKQYKSLLLSVYFNLNQHLTQVLRIIRAITFRYNVIGKLNPNDLEKAYNTTAIKVHNKEITTPQTILKELSDVYIDDESFKNVFTTKTFDTRKTKEKKLVRYILVSFENQKFNKNYYPLETDATIEHIFPENYMNSEYRIDEAMLYRLGNLTLLEPKLNRECGNKSFEEKKEIYKNSQYELTKELSDFEEWEVDTIRQRQAKLANIAASIWKADY